MARIRRVNKSSGASATIGGTTVTRVSMSWGGGSPVVNRFSAPGLRGELGRYIEREKQSIAAARAENEKLARQFQSKVIDEVSVFNRRPSTGRLRKAMESNRNIFVDDSGQSWGFGNVNYLNRSQARYWRTIDEGSAATFKRGGMIGMKIYPMVFPNRAPGLSKFLAWYSGVTPDNKFAGTAGTDFPRGKIRAVPAATGLDFEARFPGYEPITIKREIQPHNYFNKAFEEMLPEVRRGRAWKVALDTAWKHPGK